MKKILLATFASLVLIVGGSFVYQNYFKVNESLIEVTCDNTYNYSENEILLECFVLDEDQIMNVDFPLTLTLFDDDNNVLSESILSAGDNDILFDNLEFNASYNLKIDGYYILELKYIENNYYSSVFTTAYEDFSLPSFTTTVLEITDLSMTLNIALIDLFESVTSFEIIIMKSGDEVSTLIIDDLDNLDVIISNLSQESDYTFYISAVFEMNDYQVGSTEEQIVQVTTLRTPIAPYALISNAGHDNITFEFDLTTSDEDATDVTYLVELVDGDEVVLESFNPSTSKIMIDISAIESDVTLNIKASYKFLEVDYIDEILTSYVVYTNQYANFYTVPTLHLVDTSLPITNYADYDDYIYTFYNAGETEFTINCSFSIDCTVFVDNSLFSEIVFDIEGYIHPYYSPRTIAYSYSTETINITLDVGYTTNDIAILNQKIEMVLDSIIIDGMTDEQKVKAVHDYVITNSVYDILCYDESDTCDTDHSAIGVLFDGNAVCEGYAHAVDIMLRALRIPTFRISSEDHQWNAVLIDDIWYHLDVTWDDPAGTPGIDYLEYDYYLIDTVTLHTLDTTPSHDYSIKYIDFID